MIGMVHKDDEYCFNEDRIVKLESEIAVKKARLNHYKEAMKELDGRVDEVEEKQSQIELAFTEAIDSVKIEISSLHTTIKTIGYIGTAVIGFGGLIIAAIELLK